MRRRTKDSDMKQRQRAAPMTKAELRAQSEQAMAMATKPIVKLPTKLVRQCGGCGEYHLGDGGARRGGARIQVQGLRPAVKTGLDPYR